MSNHLLGQAVPLAVVLSGFTNISGAVKYERHHVHLIAEAVTPVDR
jgi:hypothetical protein